MQVSYSVKERKGEPRIIKLLNRNKKEQPEEQSQSHHYDNQLNKDRIILII